MRSRLRSSPCQASTHSLLLLLSCRYISSLTGTPVTCWFTASTSFAFPVIPRVYYSLAHNCGFFHGVWCFWSTFFITRKVAGSFPCTFLHEPHFFWDSLAKPFKSSQGLCIKQPFRITSITLMFAAPCLFHLFCWCQTNCLTLLWTAVQACHSRSVFCVSAQSPKHRSRCLRHCLANEVCDTRNAREPWQCLCEPAFCRGWQGVRCDGPWGRQLVRETPGCDCPTWEFVFLAPWGAPEYMTCWLLQGDADTLYLLPSLYIF